MTNAQAKQIREFRTRGAGYKAIASVLGLSRDVIRNYCKSCGLDGHASEVVMNFKEQSQQADTCQQCGAAVIQPSLGRKRKFCSIECRRKWWNAHPNYSNRSENLFYDKTCLYCKKNFTVYSNKKQRYCSHECYVNDRFWRKEEGREPYISPTKCEEKNYE